MKTVLLFTAACILVCTAYAAPTMFDTDEAQRESDRAKEQFHFHIYNRDEINRLKNRLAERGNELAKEQFHFHIYNRDKANQLKDENAERENELAKEQFHFHVYNQDKANQLKDRNAERENELAKEQFHFHIYNRDKANQLKDGNAERENELAKEQFHFHIYNRDKANQEQYLPVFSRKGANEQDEDAERASHQSHEIVSAIESLPEKAQAQFFGRLLASLLE